MLRQESYRSGHNGADSKSVCRATGTRVRIPPTPHLLRPGNPENKREPGLHFTEIVGEDMKKIKKLIKIVSIISAVAAVIALIKDRSDAKKKVHKHKPAGPYEAFIKRPMDAFLSTAALVVLSPVLVVVAILVRLKLGSPIFFTQDRPGWDEKVFKLYKFRTMTDDRDENGDLLPDEDRLPFFGKLLRSTSLDELPELLNIIRGDMALVGPRPLLVKYLPRYNETQRRRHEVRPGLTGLASATLRNSGTWEEKFDMDVQYVDHVSFLTDLKIIFLTAKIVLKREGVTDNTATRSEFFGTEAPEAMNSGEAEEAE